MKKKSKTAPAEIVPAIAGGAENGVPSSRELGRSTLIAAAIASAVLVTVVLPAEYGVDPTRVGRVLGLTQMGEIKMELAREAALARRGETETSVAAPTPAVNRAAPAAAVPAQRAPSAAPSASPSRSDVTRVTLRPNEAKEVKLEMRRGARVAYSWVTNGGGVSYDTHADRPSGGPYHSYSKGRDTRSHQGALVAAFDGLHGWFWRNRTAENVTVTLNTEGDYQDLKELQ